MPLPIPTKTRSLIICIIPFGSLFMFAKVDNKINKCKSFEDKLSLGTT
jgi:hypothetical protein